MTDPKAYNQMMDVLYCRWMGHDFPYEPQEDKFTYNNKIFSRMYLQCRRCGKIENSYYYPNATEFFDNVTKKVLSEVFA